MQLSREQQELAASCFKLACKLGKEAAARAGMSHEEDVYISEALFQLSRCAARFDPSKGYRFTTFAHVSLSRNLLGFRRTMAERAARRKELPYDESVSQLPEIKRSLPAEEDLAGCLEAVRQTVSPQQWQALWLHHGMGLTLKETGAILGYSHERVRQLAQDARDRLRDSSAAAQVTQLLAG